MNKNDISDAMDFLDEDMIRHTEIMRKKWEQQKREGGMSEEFVSIDTLLAAEDDAAKTDMGQVLEKVDLGDYVGLYEAASSAGSEVLSESMGTELIRVEVSSESTGTEVAVSYYRVAGHTDLQYLIRRQTVTESSAESGADIFIPEQFPAH